MRELMRRGLLTLLLVYLLLAGATSLGTDSNGFVIPVIRPVDRFAIGNYIEFGTYYGEPILWRVIHVDKDGDPLLLADRILTLKAYDSRGDFHPGIEGRVEHGSSKWEDSNIRQWLNSEELRITWWQNEPKAENIFLGWNPYDREKGFLANGNFTSSERKLIKD